MTDRLKELADALHEARVEVTPDEERLAVDIYRRLAKGEPARLSDLAADAGRDEEWVAERLERWSPGVFRDDDGNVIGFWGLTVSEMGHELEVDGRTVYTWCAWDALFIPPILGTAGLVSSTCPVTGTAITMTVDPDGVRDVRPPTAVMSMVEPKEMSDVVEEFCHHILFFATPAAAERWAGEHPGAVIISVDDGFELGKRARLFGTDGAAG